MIAALERGGPPALKDAARTQAEVMILIGLPAAVGLALVARPLADVMVGEDLRDGAARVIPWIAASGFFGGLTTYYLDNAFTLAKRPGAADRLHGRARGRQPGAEPAADPALRPRRRDVGLDHRLRHRRGRLATSSARRVLPLPCLGARSLPRVSRRWCMAGAVKGLPSVGGFPELLMKVVVGAIAYTLIALFLDVAGVRSRLAALRARPALANS